MLTLGVTGGLGSGKSTACSFFKAHGCKIFDADMVAKEILFSSEIVKQELVRTFGTNILHNGEIFKPALADIVFSSSQNQQILNTIIHPLVADEFIKEKVRVKEDIYIMDAALIFEACLQYHFDKTVLIYADKQVRMQRALKRGNLSKGQIENRMGLQMDEEEKRSLADIVIDNNGTIGELKNKIDELMQNLV